MNNMTIEEIERVNKIKTRTLLFGTDADDQKLEKLGEIRCPECKGRGFHPNHFGPEECVECGGRGTINAQEHRQVAPAGESVGCNGESKKGAK